MNIILYLSLVLISSYEVKCNNRVEYAGENFPVKYLSVEDNNFTSSDLDHYIKHLTHVLDYFNLAPNESDVNVALTSYFAKSLLKRTCLDYANKISINQGDAILSLINKAENLVSHYVYENAPYGWYDLEYRVSLLFRDDASQMYTISDFNRNRLKQWILTKDNNVNTFLEVMDNATLSRDMYQELSGNFEDYYIDIGTSNVCISEVAYNKEPIDFSQMRKCKDNAICYNGMMATPSIAYSLSHRWLNIYLLHSTKRCYVKSEEEDKILMDQLCANMYRESVYLARRGFFARDMFLEHVGFCALLGYEEFHRKNWFNKAITWIQKCGCISEDKNFRKRRGLNKLLNSDEEDIRKRTKNQEEYCNRISTECEDHPTAFMLLLLAHAIRYTAYIMK